MRAEILGVKSAARIIIDTAIGILQETDAAYWSGEDYHLPKIKAMIKRLEVNVQAVRLAYETATKVQEVSHE